MQHSPLTTGWRWLIKPVWQPEVMTCSRCSQCHRNHPSKRTYTRYKGMDPPGLWNEIFQPIRGDEMGMEPNGEPNRFPSSSTGTTHLDSRCQASLINLYLSPSQSLLNVTDIFKAMALSRPAIRQQSRKDHQQSHVRKVLPLYNTRGPNAEQSPAPLASLSTM